MNRIQETRNRSALPVLVLVLVVVTFGAASARAQSDEVLTLDIPSQDAGSALLTLAKSSGMQIMLAGRGAAKVEVEGLQGEYRLEEALAALLSDTGLAYEFTSENVVVVQEVEQDVEPEAADEAPVEDDEEPIELASQTVTGTRLTSGDPSARVISFTAEDIAARGVNDLEELFRTLPWAFPSITPTTSTYYGGGVSDTDTSTGQHGLGLATLNLRSMGSDATLVLVNGRRVAGHGGNFRNFANILNVPLSSIERVDIQLDGASAIYGSDAIGGVVNFITKSRYRGISATYREEFSSTDADVNKISAQGGYSWGSGSVFANLSRTKSKPVNNLKIWTSNDMRDQFGPEFDLRDRDIGQPGVVCEHNGRYGSGVSCAWPPKPTMQLQAGHSGIGATEGDFTTDILPWDYVDPQNGMDSTINSLTLRLEQNFGDDWTVNADFLFTKGESYRAYQPRWYRFLVPASNAFNPLGRDVVVSYFPRDEFETGSLPPAYITGYNIQRNYNAGFAWQFAPDHSLEFNTTRSESRSNPRQGMADYNRTRLDPTQEKFYAALESSDPNVALNLFGDGTAQAAAFSELLTEANYRRDGSTDVTAYDAFARGDLFRIWGGPVSYVAGAEFRETAQYSLRWYHEESGEEWRWSGLDTYGVPRAVEELSAYFAEFSLPIVGEENSRPGLRSLILSLQARRDDYEYNGGAGGVSTRWVTVPSEAYVAGVGWQDLGFRWVREAAGTAKQGSVKRTATSPRVGIQYKPVDSLKIRAAWGESFQPPIFNYQFSVYEPSGSSYGYSWVDPLHPDTPGVRIRTPYASSNWNPELQSEFATKTSVGFEWNSESIAGLRWSVDWSKVDFIDKVHPGGNLFFYYSDILAGIPDVVHRDADGYPTMIVLRPINVAEKLSELVETTIQYDFETNVGRFIPSLTYSRFLEESFLIVEGSEPIERLGTAYGSDEYQLTGQLTWNWGPFGADLFVYHIPGYENARPGRCKVEGVGECRNLSTDLPTLQVDSMTTVNLTMTYEFDNGLRLRAGGRNILDEKSPTVWNYLPYDPVRWDARGQVLFLELTWEM